MIEKETPEIKAKVPEESRDGWESRFVMLSCSVVLLLYMLLIRKPYLRRTVRIKILKKNVLVLSFYNENGTGTLKLQKALSTIKV